MKGILLLFLGLVLLLGCSAQVGDKLNMNGKEYRIFQTACQGSDMTASCPNATSFCESKGLFSNPQGPINTQYNSLIPSEGCSCTIYCAIQASANVPVEYSMKKTPITCTQLGIPIGDAYAEGNKLYFTATNTTGGNLERVTITNTIKGEQLTSNEYAGSGTIVAGNKFSFSFNKFLEVGYYQMTISVSSDASGQLFNIPCTTTIDISSIQEK